MVSEEDLQSLYKYAVSLTANDALAYDLVHEALIKTRKYFIFNQKAYLKKSIKNIYYDQIKYQQKFAPEELIESLSNTSVEEEVKNKQHIGELLVVLTSQERELLFLFYVEGYSYKEISKIMKLNIGTVMSKLNRCKTKMKRSDDE